MSLRFTLLFCLLSLLWHQAAVAQATAVGTVNNVHCHGDSTGSIIYQINGGPGPVHYSWNTGDTGSSVGGCTYSVVITNPNALLTNFQVKVVVNLATGMNSNFSNVSFTDASNNPLPFWLQDFPTASTATFWVNVPSIPSGVSNIFLTFCNTTPVAGNPIGTFEYFDNFDNNTFPLWTQSCPRSSQGASCGFGTSTTTYFSSTTSAQLTGTATCFSSPYAGVLTVIDRTVPVSNDSLVIDYENMIQVNLQGYCSGNTSSQSAVAADNVQLGTGQSISHGGSCGITTSPWALSTSNPFAVTTGNTDIALEVYGGDCDDSKGWFDDVRIRKFRANPPVATINTTPQLTLNHLAAGLYIVTLTTANNIVTLDSFTVTQSGALTATLDSTNIACHGASTGAAWVVSGNLGGTPRVNYPNYSFQWTPGGLTTDTISALTAGFYQVIVTDSFNCHDTASVNVTQPAAAVSAVGDSINVACYGGATGKAWAIVSGGTLPYTYSWNTSPVQTTDTAIGLTPGYYTVAISDNAGCATNVSVNITQPALPLSLTQFTSPVLCYGQATGTASVTASGGTPGYAYHWNTLQTTDTIKNVLAGSYTVTVTDTLGCTATTTVSVAQPSAALTLTMDSSKITCSDSTNGVAWAIVTGGTPGYTYLWNTSQTTDTISALGSGVYSIIVTDANGCTISGAVNIPVSTDTVVLDSSVTAATCGLSNGTITIIPSRGTSPYSYSWSPSEPNAATITGLAGGTFNVTVTDALHCVSSRSVSISQFPILTYDVNTINDTCDGGRGQITINITSGTAPYTKTWLPAVSNPLALDSGSYNLTVTDSVGCTKDSTILISNVGIKPAPSFAGIDTSLCPGSKLVLNPGTFTTYLWQDMTTQPQFTVSTIGYYSVTVSNALGCKATASITIVDNCSSEVVFPTGFSPNGDGRNDDFHPVYTPDLSKFHMRIYDRWGELVYESFDFTEGWDGNYKNVAQPVGTYVWFAEYAFTDKRSENKTGTITLLR